MSHPRGFTLFELIMVMVIVCIVLGMAAPSLRNFWASRRSDDVAAQLLALTQWARTQAISNGRIYRLNIEPQEGVYYLTVQDGDQFIPLDEEMGRVFGIPEEMRLNMVRSYEAAAPFVEFFPSGRMDPAIISISDPYGAEIRIVCDSPTESFHIVSNVEVRG